MPATLERSRRKASCVCAYACPCACGSGISQDAGGQRRRPNTRACKCVHSHVGQVDGVVFRPPKLAFVLVPSSAEPLRIELDKAWKRAEVSNLLARMGVPNNFEDVR